MKSYKYIEKKYISLTFNFMYNFNVILKKTNTLFLNKINHSLQLFNRPFTFYVSLFSWREREWKRERQQNTVVHKETICDSSIKV